LISPNSAHPILADLASSQLSRFTEPRHAPDLVRTALEETLNSVGDKVQIAIWDERLNSVGDDAQLANVDIQIILQEQQQVLQMASNIGKMLVDTAMAVMPKIGG